ncbi:5-carboxymethyl-2-hydroxymuconate Delta-isomerase [Andreprevotia chitinilytica]|uniref:5-carboxymethyl-2-hydroxymuconate Delta-isomerase n=1 Tax=Andreprevotia chitinilytica TaxID=396808 RepID=UPI00054DCD46|nr:5-carboxymethyl-2-hydroxymuconate Delta-isomerase [Andreprevotia chitinilytica]
MPHFIAECTDNLRESADLPGLFEKVHTYLAGTSLFPLGGIRSRAIWLDTWRMADGAKIDGKDDYAFAHMTLKIGHGRSIEDRKRVGEELFALIKAHFAPISAERYLALSFEITELHAELNYKQNNVHDRFR